MDSFRALLATTNDPRVRRFMRAVLRANGVVDVETMTAQAALDVMAVLALSGRVPEMAAFRAIAYGEPIEQRTESNNAEKSLETLLRGL